MKQEAMGTRIETGKIEVSRAPNSDYSELAQGVAARVAAYHGELRGVLNVAMTEDPNYYHAYPFLFRDEFPSVSDAEASTIAVAGVFYLNHLCLLDDIVDNPGASQPYKLFMSALLHEESLAQLATLFTPASPFWARLTSYHREFARVMLHEQEMHTGRLTPFTGPEAFHIAKGKAALSKMTTSALALLGNRPDTIANLSASQDCFNAARQMYDDVKDWKDDYLNRRYSSLLTAALLELSGGETKDPQGSISVGALSTQLHYGGHIDHALAQAAEWCDEAAMHVAGYQVAGWSSLIQSLRAQVVRLRGDLATIRERAAIPDGSSRAQPAEQVRFEAESA